MRSRESKNWFKSGWRRFDRALAGRGGYSVDQRLRINFRARVALAESLRLTANELLDETVAVYSANPASRGVSVNADKSQCVYLTTEGCNCAVGRCFIHGVTLQLDTGETLPITTTENVSVTRIINLESILLHRYRGHSVYLWELLQNLHDREDYWNENGITTEGLKYVDSIREIAKKEGWK